jgi:hypothetical protein
VRELGQRLDVDAQQAERVVEIGLGEQAKGAEARVVDQVVDADAGVHHAPGSLRSAGRTVTVKP